MKKLTVNLPNLTCASCVLEVEQVMRQQEGVVWAIVNFAAREATIIYDPRSFRISQLVQAVSALGIQVQIRGEAGKNVHPKHVEARPFNRMQQWVRTLAR